MGNLIYIMVPPAGGEKRPFMGERFRPGWVHTTDPVFNVQEEFNRGRPRSRKTIFGIKTRIYMITTAPDRVTRQSPFF